MKTAKMWLGLMSVVLGIGLFGCTNPVKNTPQSTTKEITKFYVASLSISGVITEKTHTINLTVPFATNVTSLVPSITHTGVRISPASDVKQDFSLPVTYNVTAENGTSVDYIVSVVYSAVLPSVTTYSVSSFTSSAAVCGGNVTTDGGTKVTAFGVCWSVKEKPTILDTHSNDGAGVGVFTSNMIGLTTGVTYYVRAYATNSIGTAYGTEVNVTISLVPTILTTGVTHISGTFAECGANITSDGGSPVTSRGLCWSITSNPTIVDNYTNEGIGSGGFVSQMTLLQKNTNYYVKAYATNALGTAYGSEISFVTSGYDIGDTGPAGGFVFYDKGNNVDGWRYLEAAPNDQSTYMKWDNGVDDATGAIGTVIGSGKSNTQTIINSQGIGTYAAEICADLVLGGYDDWFLPSIDELSLMDSLWGRNHLAGFTSNSYWSSSEATTNHTSAWYQYMSGMGDQGSATKYITFYVRAIRNF